MEKWFNWLYMVQKNQQKTLLLVFVCLNILYGLPLLLLGENAYLTLTDNLDSDFLHLIHLVRSGHAFHVFDSTARIEQVMNGIPRTAYRSGLNVVVLLFSCFKNPLHAYLTNHFIIHLWGFWGMLLLAKQYVFSQKPLVFSLLLALIFSILPTYNVYGITVMGQPFLLYAFLNLYHHKPRWTNWLIIAIFPFYSFIVYVGPFIVFLLALVILWHYWRYRQFPIYFCSGTALLLGLYVLAESSMIFSYFSDTFVSHRTAYQALPFDFTQALNEIFDFLTKGYFHSGQMSYYYLLSLGVLGLFWYKNRFDILLFVVIASIIVLHGFYRYWIQFLPIHLLLEFNFSRFSFLLPLLSLVLFGRVITRVSSHYLAFGLLFVQFLLMFWFNDEFKENLQRLAGKPSLKPSYSQFFAQKQFQTIRNFIHLPQDTYRVVSVGIEPSVAQFNGFYTLDGYQANYALTYHQQFGKFIAPELKKNRRLSNYYYLWGNRAYIFSQEVFRHIKYQYQNKTRRKQVLKNGITQLALDMHVFREMGGKYVFSAYPIQNAESLHLHLLKRFSDSKSWWDVYLYAFEPAMAHRF